MARDTKRKRSVALKIMKPGPMWVNEIKMDGEIKRVVRDTSRLLLSTNCFPLPSPYGDYKVHVYPICGPSLDKLYIKRMVAARMAAARPLLEAVASLHEGGILHRGMAPSLGPPRPSAPQTSRPS